jgi:hypothetical protein
VGVIYLGEAPPSHRRSLTCGPGPTRQQRQHRAVDCRGFAPHLFYNQTSQGLLLRGMAARPIGQGMFMIYFFENSI